MRKRISSFLAGSAIIAFALISSPSSKAEEWYIAVRDGTCVSATLITAASSGYGWQSPYVMAEALKKLGVDVNLETTRAGPYLMVGVRIGAAPGMPTLDHANFAYFNDKDFCLRIAGH